MTQRLNAIPYDQFEAQVKANGIRIITGPFVTRLYTPLKSVIRNTYLLYSEHEVDLADGFSDFHLNIVQPNSFRRWYRPQVNFSFDELTPFKPLPVQQAYAIFEWGLNWCISNYAHIYMAVHSAVLEKNGVAILLPGEPGAGKSTLCASLALSGWRLFSDEMALFSPDSGRLVSNPRPIGLKNQSIEVISQKFPDAVLGTAIHDTTKGTVAHLKPPVESVHRSSEPATPRFVVFPRFRPDASSTLTPMTKSRAFMSLCDNAFNYNIHSDAGFHLMKQIIDNCDCFQFEYSRLEEAIKLFDSMVENQPTSVSA